MRVIDRNLLILEVFDKRAFTNEAKLQIRLAKLKYTLSWGREFIKLRGIMGEQLGWMGQATTHTKNTTEQPEIESAESKANWKTYTIRKC